MLGMEQARFRRERNSPLWLIAAAAGLAMPAAGETAGMSQERHTTPLPPPRAGDAAVTELEAARRAGTIAAYDLFLARHPTHRLARTARRERRLIVEMQKPSPD
jgi:hypothetical protein